MKNPYRNSPMPASPIPGSLSTATTSRCRVKITSRASLSMVPGWCQITFLWSRVVSFSTSLQEKRDSDIGFSAFA